MITSNVSFLRGPTHSYVTSAQDRSPQDRYLTSHRYSARPTRLPSPTAEPAPEVLLTRSEFPFTIHYVKGPPVVTSIHCYNRHVEATRFFMFWGFRYLLWRMLCHYSIVGCEVAHVCRSSDQSFGWKWCFNFRAAGITTKSVLKNREIESNIKIIPKILLYITENCAVHFSNKKCAQIKFTLLSQTFQNSKRFTKVLEKFVLSISRNVSARIVISRIRCLLIA